MTERHHTTHPVAPTQDRQENAVLPGRAGQDRGPSPEPICSSSGKSLTEHLHQIGSARGGRADAAHQGRAIRSRQMRRIAAWPHGASVSAWMIWLIRGLPAPTTALSTGDRSFWPSTSAKISCCLQRRKRKPQELALSVLPVEWRVFRRTRAFGRIVMEAHVVQQPGRFGELRRRRLAPGLFLTCLAQRFHYSKGQLSKVERGIKMPSRELVRLCDAALDAGGSLTTLIRDKPLASRVTVTVDSDRGEVWLMQLCGGGQSWFQPVSRRQLMAPVRLDPGYEPRYTLGFPEPRRCDVSGRPSIFV